MGGMVGARMGFTRLFQGQAGNSEVVFLHVPRTPPTRLQES